MNDPRELGVPDYVPDELVEKYGPAATGRGVGRSPRSPQTAHPSGRPKGWMLGLTVAGGVAVIATILIVLVALTPSPVVTVGVLLAVLLAAVIATRMVTRTAP